MSAHFFLILMNFFPYVTFLHNTMTKNTIFANAGILWFLWNVILPIYRSHPLESGFRSMFDPALQAPAIKPHRPPT